MPVAAAGRRRRSDGAATAAVTVDDHQSVRTNHCCVATVSEANDNPRSCMILTVALTIVDRLPPVEYRY